MNKSLIRIAVRTAGATQGQLVLPGVSFRCALGRSGIRQKKCEGDGATPRGIVDIRRLFFRPDRVARPTTALETYPLNPNLGWCDDPTHSAYNSLIRLPFPGSHEKMWRQDHLYDVVIELGYNDRPPIPGRGSAIFLHIEKNNYAPTEGCIAISLEDMRRFLAHLKPGDRIII